MRSLLKKIFGKGKGDYIEKTTSKPLPLKLVLDKLTVKEVDWIRNNMGFAGELIKDLGIESSSHTFDPESVGKAIKSWFEIDLQNRFEIDVNMYSNALASGWGNYLEETLGMEWYAITDEFGTEIGLYHKNNDMTIFPFKSTAKAFNNKDFDLLSTITKKATSIIKRDDSRVD